MSNADRIEELRDKYEENPRRYFAPLANEYRKAGDLAQAIAICREHLPKQPGHMSGFIVFGQTLFEANGLEEARSVFEQALTLDPENLIALKHLGDIARLNGENGTARRWYARVLDADPRNDDIALQLASLGTPTPVIPQAAVPAPAPYSEPPLEEAVGVFATFDPSSLSDVPDTVARIAEGNEFWSPTKAQPAAQHEPLDLDFPESPEPVADADFEEGILAPEWPDTSELVARIVTPLRSATPIFVPVTPEAVEAFGRETSDHFASLSVDLTPQDELVEAFLPPEPTPPVVVTGVESIEVDALDDAAELAIEVTAENEPVDLDAIETAAVSNTAAFSEPLSVAVDEPVTAFESAESDLIEFESFEHAPESTLEEAQSAVSQLFESPQADAPVETGTTLLEWAEPDSVPQSEIEHFAFAAELPWEPEIAAESEAAAETDALEESFAEISSELQHERDASDRDALEFEAESATDVVLADEVSTEVVSADSVLNDSEPAQPFVTETMAELLVAQGFHSRAIDVYDELVRRRPHDPVLVSRLAVLRELEGAAAARSEYVVTTAPRFSTPLHNTPILNTPLYSTPLSATTVLVHSLAETVVTQSNLSERHAADRLQPFRTARERFAELSRRRVARRTPTHATAVADDTSEGLSSLFGTAMPATTDELAARALADAFGPVQDSGESLFDPAPTPTPAMPMRSLTPRSNTLVPLPQGVDPSRSDRQPSADYSFDKFFPDPAMAARATQSSPTMVASTPSSPQPVNEDLAQFSAWLKGLNNA